MKLISFSGRCPRRLGMETCPRGGFPFSQKSFDIIHSGWQWSSALCYGCCHSWLGISAPSTNNFANNSLSLVFALLGFLSPSNRGSLATVMMICWTIFGGFVSLNHVLPFSFPHKTSLVSAVTSPAVYTRLLVAWIARKILFSPQQYYRGNFSFTMFLDRR